MLHEQAVHDARPRSPFGLPARIIQGLCETVARTVPSTRPRLHRWLVHSWYSLFSALLRQGDDLTFLNYGYAPLDGDSGGLTLPVEGSDNCFSIELYRRVAGARDLRGKDVLEVGCGRGGGSSFIAQHLGPRTVTSVDFSAPALEFCRRRHQIENLVFLEGDAQALPFEKASFDAVVNVESSHCYVSFERFLQEVSRVLRPGGDVLFADLRPSNEVAKMREQLNRVFTIVEEECITPNVFRALELFSDRRKAVIRQKTPVFLRRAVRNFAAVEGTPAFEAFRRRDLEYFRFVLRKQDEAV